MSDSLKDQLLQAGLVTQEQASKAERQSRSSQRPRNPQGPRGDQRSSRTSPPQDPTQDRLQTLLRDHRVHVPVRGQQRWYFETQDGRLPYLAISEECGDLLERGEAAIVEPKAGLYRVVNAEGAEKIQTLGDSLVRFWNKPGSST